MERRTKKRHLRTPDQIRPQRLMKAVRFMREIHRHSAAGSEKQKQGTPFPSANPDTNVNHQAAAATSPSSKANSTTPAHGAQVVDILHQHTPEYRWRCWGGTTRQGYSIAWRA